MASYARHDFVWLSQRAWERILCDAPASAREAIVAWRRHDRPAIVRRRDIDAGSDEVCIGIAPPPVAGSKQRIAARVALTEIRKRISPPCLDSILPAMPSCWHAPLLDLQEAACDAGMAFRAYGSAALQYLTGEAHMTSASDIDLLFHPATQAQLATGIGLLSEHAACLPLDGEVVFGNRVAVSWKEWSAAMQTKNGARVLVKDLHTVRLMRTDELLDVLEGAR